MIKNTNVQLMFKKLNEKLINIESIQEGILGGATQKYWVKCNNKHYIFKYNYGVNDFSDFGEVFTSYLSFVLGFNCVKTVFSRDIFNDENNSLGVLVESFRTKNTKESFTLKNLLQKYRNQVFLGNSVEEAMSVCKSFCEDNNLVLDKNIEQDLKEMALMDYLLIQIDRHQGNIEFLIEEKHGINTLKLAPMFDNGFSLYLQNKASETTKILNALKNKKQEIGLNTVNPKPVFYITEEVNWFNDNDIVKDLAIELLKNKKLMKLYQNFLKLDLKKELDFMCSIYKRNLPKNHYELILKGVENRLHFLNLEILKQSIMKNDKEETF